MNPVKVWLMWLMIVASIIAIWYTTYPMVYSMIHVNESLLTTYSSGLDPTAIAKGWQTFNFLDWMNLIWAPVIALFITLWALVSSQQIDPDSNWRGM